VRVQGEAAHAEGALVASLAEDGPADAGGLRVGDVVVALAGQPVDSPAALHRALAAQSPGSVVDVEVVRAGSRTPLTLALGEQPQGRDGRACGHHGHHDHSHGAAHTHTQGHEDGHGAHRHRHDPGHGHARRP